MNAALNLGTRDCMVIETPGSNSVFSPWNLMLKEKDIQKQEMLAAGNNMNDQDLVDTLLNGIEEAVQNLEKMKVKLRPSNLGVIPDYPNPGKAVRDIYMQRLEEKGHQILGGRVVEFFMNDGRIVGVGAETTSGKRIEVLCNFLIIASGGLTGLFEYHTGSPQVDGSVLALGLRSGLLLRDLEFTMFHPFLIVDKRFPRCLVSGDILTKMNYQDEDGNEFLSRKITKALRENRHHYVFPQMTREFYAQSLKGKIFGHIDASDKWFDEFKNQNEFGRIFKRFTKDEAGKIQLHPAAHFSIGGLAIDNRARTNHSNVYAAGEASAGLHGSNRIGGLAVLEALIFGKIAAQSINGSGNARAPLCRGCDSVKLRSPSAELKSLVWENLGPVKNKEGLEKIMNFLDNKEKISASEELIKVIAKTCLLRRESIGAFCREDLPVKKNSKSSYIEKSKITFR